MKDLDPVEMAKQGLFAEMRDGVVRVIDAVTGRVVSLQAGGQPSTSPRDFTEVLLPDGRTVQVEKGLEKYAMEVHRQPELTPFLVDIICQKMVEEGKGVAMVCKEPGMPSYGVLCRWKRKHPWVAEALEQARVDRAEHLRDKAVSVAENAENPDKSIDADKLRVDTYKWAAGVDNTRYSPKAKIEANISVPTQLIITTGIDRGEVDTKVTPVETVRDVSDKKLLEK